MDEEKRQQSAIKAGPLPVDQETGLAICPPPLEIDIIKVKKVFNECMHTQVEEVVVTGFTPGLTTNADDAECVSVSATNVSCVNVSGDIVRVTFTLEVCTRVPLNAGGFQTECETQMITKTLRIDRAGEQGLSLQCHVFPTCLFCFISQRNPGNNGVEEVTCCVGILVLIKVEAEVQLLIPTFGYPPPPPECGEFLGECPTDFIPDWPPYPPQFPFTGGTDRKAKGCK
ncbi:MAG: hypothetical protein JM58_17735 [Peptococcaceae bacterium BICA1-8]|nr:MAG: hypothetical protein JM58_17735 [Peptococcaceae bacterium BICA1-8]